MDRAYLDKIFKEYNEQYYTIPEIQEYVEVNEGDYAAAKFNTKELYDQIYILKVNKQLNESEIYKGIFFHEFTHVYDSTQLLNYPFEDFMKLMYIYSEFHASEVEMDIHLKIEKFSYKKYVDKKIINLTESFILPDGPLLKGDMYCNERLLYYCIGYLVSLKKHNIEYTYSYEYVPDTFRSLFIEITEYFLSNIKYDYDVLLNYQIKLHNLIKSTIKEHIEKYNKSK
ncbi:MAG TPA: hypothetical protein DCW90_09965 [Lachnospiraceae bacterium]|nr:hypothetical protein [Lachnospiraceae bacterium]